MQSVKGFDFFPLTFDENGKLRDAGEFNDLEQHAGAATDAIFIAHGFRNDVNEATGLYTNFLDTFRAHLSRPEFHGIAARKFVVAAIYWPSKPFKESFPADEGSVLSADDDGPEMAAVIQQLEKLKDVAPEHSAKLNQAMALLPEVKNDTGAQDQFVSLVLSLLDNSELDATEGLQRIREQPGSELLDKLSTPIILPTQRAGTDSDSGGGVAAVGEFVPTGVDGGVLSIGSFFGSVFGRIGQFLNLASWYIMKNRSGVVGETGVAKAVRDLRSSQPNIKIHLVGHSLGGRLMAGCAKSLSQPPIVNVDSLTLLEAAFSHYGFSDNNGEGLAGFFRDVIANKVVTGPIVATFSFQDTVVGIVYAIASRLADDNVKAIGDANDPFGGIGRNGAQKTKESVSLQLKTPGAPYAFKSGVVTCLDGSGGLIKDHGDITNENVTYAFASALAGT